MAVVLRTGEGMMNSTKSEARVCVCVCVCVCDGLVLLISTRTIFDRHAENKCNKM
jgi:hypothetical protein